MSRILPMVQKSAIAAVAIVALFSMLGWVDRTYNEPARKTQRLVQPGMTREAVRRVAGEPRERVAKGSIPSNWGAHPERALPGDTWIYYFGLGNIHRVTVSFEGDRVVEVLHDST